MGAVQTSTKSRRKPRIADPVITEIVRRGVMAVTEDMKTNLMRTAYNLIIYEALDFTVGLFTAQGETISIGLGLPMFIRGMAETVKAKIAKFGGDIAPGDILLTNDAYITGSHLNHMTFTQPIFADSELVAFACCMAHWPDIGGQLGGITRDIFAEGLQIPILKYCAAGSRRWRAPFRTRSAPLIMPISALSPCTACSARRTSSSTPISDRLAAAGEPSVTRTALR
jgi:N-methylhydantoinase B